MPTAIITEEQWQKLKPILLDLNIYDKPSLKETFLGMVILPYLMAGFSRIKTHQRRLTTIGLMGSFMIVKP